MRDNGEAYRPPTAALLPQSINLLPKFYGRSLNMPLMAVDPFYALTELFEFTASSEVDLLNVIKAKVDDLLETSEGGNPVTTLSQSYLLYSHQILEHHVHHIKEALHFIKGRTSLKWPHSQNPNLDRKAESKATRLERDFEYLLSRAELLRAQCERKMNIMMNTASIAEANRGVEHARSVFKFTLLASFYVPLSFTASFFGMNFRQLGNGSLSLWIWIVVSVPVFGLSVLVLFWDPKIFWGWPARIRNYLYS
jgi:Mg2+ and Co2+ transporter CorA